MTGVSEITGASNSASCLRGFSGSIRFEWWKCLFPFGKTTVIVVPCCSTLSIFILPLWRWTNFPTNFNPIPLPVIFALIAFVPRKCILNNLLCSFDGIPMPVSLTSSFQESLVSETYTLTVPFSGVYFNALDIRFFKMESILSLSNHTFR